MGGPLDGRLRIESVETLSDDWRPLTRTTFAFRRSDGVWQTQTRETYERRDAAAILLFDPDRRCVVLVRQFRYPAYVQGWRDLMIEVPAGVLDDLAAEERIRLEAEEETGYRPAEVSKVFEAFASPGAITEKLHCFVGRYGPADQISSGGGLAEEGEDIEILELPFDEAMAMIASGEICDAKTIMLLQHAALHIFR